MILLMMVMVLRYIAHQKGTYYTNEEDLAFKSDPEEQDVSESPEDPEEGKSQPPPFFLFGFKTGFKTENWHLLLKNVSITFFQLILIMVSKIFFTEEP